MGEWGVAIDARIVALLCVLALAIGLWLARVLRGSASQRRNAIAQSGEREAELLLRDAGYRVVERQARARWSILVDDEPVEFEVRADLVVSRGARRFVAEVKTGERAPDLRHGPTRRQLLEYALVFGADEVLLVDVPAGQVRRVVFEL